MHFPYVAIFRGTKQLSFLLYNPWFCSFKVPLYELIMYLPNWPRHEHANIFANKFFPSVPNYLLHFLICVYNCTYQRRTSRYDYDGACCILTENVLLIILILIALFCNFTLKDSLCARIILKSVELVMNYLKEKISISIKELNFLWIYLLKFYSNFLNLFIIVWYIGTLLLKIWSINLFLE